MQDLINEKAFKFFASTSSIENYDFNIMKALESAAFLDISGP